MKKIKGFIKHITTHHLHSVLVVLFLVVFITTFHIFAGDLTAVPAGGYAPGVTLNPDCAPGSSKDCVVKTAVSTSDVLASVFNQGTNVVSASEMDITPGSSLYDVTGSVQINRISKTGFTSGQTFTLKFGGSPTITNNFTPKKGDDLAGTYFPIILKNGVDYQPNPNSTLTLIYDDTDQAFYEIARTEAPPSTPSSAKNITAFSILGYEGIINGTNITVGLPYGTDVTSLTPVIRISRRANISSAPPVDRNGGTDFTNPKGLNYTITAADGSSQTYTVIVTTADSNSKDITEFNIDKVDGTIGTDKAGAATISLTAPYRTDITSLTPTITYSGINISPASGIAQNFTNPVIYTVAAANGSVKMYTVTVTVALNNDATLNVSASTIKGIGLRPSVVGTPSAIFGSETTGGPLTLSLAEAADKSGDAPYVTSFVPTDDEGAIVVKVVKYSTGADTSNFATDKDYNNEAISNQDFFIIEVMAADKSILYYKIVVALPMATAPSYIGLTAGKTDPVGGVTDIVDPGAGGTDTTGAVTGWVTGTADTIAFTVTDDPKGSATSTITIRKEAYTSGTDYVIRNTDDLTIVVTTTEKDKLTAVRTFTVTVSPPIVNVGESYGGGAIVYILQPGDSGYNAHLQHGLIVQLSDQSTGIQWYNGSYTTTGATETALGTGLANTEAIVASQGTTGGYAALLCYNPTTPVTINGYSDWYLPSRDEINLAYTTIAGLNGDYYWSSSEQDTDDAFRQIFYKHNGTQDKDTLNYVRCFRSF